MDAEHAGGVVDSLTLRFTGEDSNGVTLHELRAAHVAEVLQGLVGLSSDFTKAGVFGDGPAGSEVLVRPAREGSFLIEVVRFVQDNADNFSTGAGVAGVPALGQVVWWATKSARANVEDIEYLENGNVKIIWQDDTVDEVPVAAWRELSKRKRRRKNQLRQIMTPLSDGRVASLEVQSSPATPAQVEQGVETFTLTRPDYNSVLPDDEISERQQTVEVEAQMSAIDFDNPGKWRIKTLDGTRRATVEDEAFLAQVAGGLAIRKTDIFRLTVREDMIEKNGRARRKWTVLKVDGYRRSYDDDGA